MNVLVTGSDGLVGTALREIMPEATYVSKGDYDLCRQHHVENMIRNIRPNHIVHLAARVGGILDNINHQVEYFEENVLMNTFIVKYAHKYDIPMFTGILSSCSYPETASHYPMKEDVLFRGEAPKTNNTYAVSKRAMATHINAHNEQYGTKYNYLIPCNLYGERATNKGNKGHFIAALVENIYNTIKRGDSSITLMGDGSPLRQHLYVDDLARVIKMVVEGGITRSFNIAPPENISIRDIAKVLCDDLGLGVEFDTTKPSGQYRKDIDTSLFNSIFPNFVFTPFEVGLKRCYEYYEENQFGK